MAYSRSRRAPRTAAYRSGARRSSGRRSAAVSAARSRMPRRARNVRDPGYVDLAASDYAMDSTGTITLLNTIPQGASQSERVGKRINLKGLQHRGVMTGGSTCTFCDVSMIIVYDKRPSGVLPAITDILEATLPNALNNNTNASRFRILKRVDTTLIGNSGNLTANTAKSSDFYLPLRNLPQVFNAVGTGAIGDIEEGALYLVTVGNVAAPAAGNLNGTFPDNPKSSLLG